MTQINEYRDFIEDNIDRIDVAFVVSKIHRRKLMTMTGLGGFVMAVAFRMPEESQIKIFEAFRSHLDRKPERARRLLDQALDHMTGAGWSEVELGEFKAIVEQSMNVSRAA